MPNENLLGLYIAAACVYIFRADYLVSDNQLIDLLFSGEGKLSRSQISSLVCST